MAKATAEEVGADAWSELALYLVHGLLHLLGHDDRTVEGASEMREREAFHLSAEGLSNTFGLVEGRPASDPSGREGAPCPA